MTTDLEQDERVQRDLARDFRARLPGDSLLVLLGHSSLMALVAGLVWSDARAVRIGWWAAAVLVTTAARALWLWNAARPELTDSTVLAGARAAATLQALSWSVGAAIVMPVVPMSDIAVILVVIAGIGAGSLATLAPDAPSFHGFLLGLGGPLPFGILASATDRRHLVAVGVVVIFTITMLTLFRRAHEVLKEHLRTTILLKDSLARVKTLHGLLPICAVCKSIRNDAGYWTSVESYLSDNSDASFSHAVCPTCFPKLYPGVPFPGDGPD